MGSWTLPDTRGPRARTGETATLPAQPRAWTGPRDVRSTKKAKCFRETPCPGSGGDRAPAEAASPSPGEPACGKGWNLIRVTIKPPCGTPASRVSLAGRWGQPRPAPELQLHLPGPRLSPPTAATGPAGKLRQRPGGLARGLEAGGLRVRQQGKAPPLQPRRDLQGPRPRGCAGPPAESRSRKGQGRAGLQVGLIAPCCSAAPRTPPHPGGAHPWARGAGRDRGGGWAGA